jgi:hypothetical protein
LQILHCRSVEDSLLQLLFLLANTSSTGTLP